MDPRVLSIPMTRVSSMKFPPSSRSHIESLDAGLTSVNGALEIIAEMRSRQLVTKLILGHNELGDEGCEVLFGFLDSEEGRRYPIAEISLNSNGIGDRGLEAITQYLTGNSTLKELFLQNNSFTGNAEGFVAFAQAINSSHLETLSLTTNPKLSDSFIEQFLHRLDSSHLREMQLSVIGVTQASAPHFAEYISSSRCRLSSLKVNGNRLGVRGARMIIRALQRHNFTLTKLEMYANGLADADASSETTASDDDIAVRAGLSIWHEAQKELDRLLLRNLHLKRTTEREALVLLKYARTVLLRPKSDGSSTSLALVPSSMDSLFSSILSSSVDHAPTFPFTRLPTELQLHVLSFLAPTLSTAQRIRIYTYAASPATLPPLLPSLSSRVLPNPSMMPFGGVGMGVGMMLRKRTNASASGKAAGDRDIINFRWRRDEERSRWLAFVRCNAFELEEDGSEGDGLSPRM